MFFTVNKKTLFAMLVFLFGVEANNFDVEISWDILHCNRKPRYNQFPYWQSTSDKSGSKFTFQAKGIPVVVSSVDTETLLFHVPLHQTGFLFSNMMTTFGYVFDNNNMPRFSA